MHDRSHAKLVLRALRALSAAGPVPVAAVVTEAVRAGLVTRDRLGAGHRVRTELMALKAARRAWSHGRNRWSTRRSPEALRALDQGLAAAAPEQARINADWDACSGDGLDDAF
jgi:hypothetical protein